MRHDEAVARLVRYWERLAPADVERLHEVYADDAYFRDPFNEVRGVEAIKPLFRHMFETLHEPRFTILETVAGEGGVFLVWDFDFRIKSLQPQRTRRIHGTSHIRFAPDGRVAYHRDYWDSAGELFAGLPVLGPLMRFLARRMSPSKSST
jgi:steroid Delta-isomerase